MFCRFGSVLDSRPVAAIIWLNVVWIRPLVVDHRDQRVDDGLEPGDVAVPQQALGQIGGVVACRASHASASASVV